MPLTSVAVIIVNYGTANLALSAAQSVLDADNGALKVHVHIVDNAATPPDAPYLADQIVARDWAEQVTLHVMDQNLGFGRGNNVVLDPLIADPSGPGFAFLLNPDARLENNAIARLHAALIANPHAGAAGARIEDGHGTPVTAAFRFPSILSELLHGASFGPLTRLLAAHQVALPADLPSCQVDWVAGAAVMLRCDALRATGTFHPGYFLYYEEVDLMRALSRGGWQTLFVSDARVSHIEGAATGIRSSEAERTRRPRYLYESWRLYFTRNHGRVYALCAGLAWAAGAALNHTTSALRNRRPAAPLRLFPDLWANVLRPLLSPGASR